jgi:hypothetical protein
MSKEFDAVEINMETASDPSEQILTQLNELSLALIGGGLITVSL